MANNLLNKALRAVGGEKLTWYRYKNRTQNARGEWVSSYHSGVVVFGQMQPISANKVKALGIDETRRTWTFWTSNALSGVSRGSGADYMQRGSIKFDIVSVTDWTVNGWKEVILVELGQ